MNGDMILVGKTNTEIRSIIDRLKISAMDKAILAERIFDGATYDSIIQKYYGKYLSPTMYEKKVREIQRIEQKLYAHLS